MRIVAIVSVLMIGFSHPAIAARSCPANATQVVIQQRSILPSAAADPATGKGPSMVVDGGGQARLTDPDGATFSHQFAISATVNKDGSAKGKAEFVFPGQFAQKWGAVPGEELIRLTADITAGAQAGDGSVTLTGPFIETDYSRKDGIVFREDSQETGATPLKIVIAGPPASGTFTLSWCSFIPPNNTGSFLETVTNGNLHVHSLPGH